MKGLYIDDIVMGEYTVIVRKKKTIKQKKNIRMKNIRRRRNKSKQNSKLTAIA